MNYLTNTEFSFTGRLARNVLPFADCAFNAGLAHMTDCSRCSGEFDETTEYAFYHCKQVHPYGDNVGEVTARIYPKQLVLLDADYTVEIFNPQWTGVKRRVFSSIQAVSRLVI